jgi:dihydroorotase-like cyclic amidohydrolase
MIDLGLFLAEPYSHSAAQVEQVLSGLKSFGLNGGVLHQNQAGKAVGLSYGFRYAIDARQLGQSDIKLADVRLVSYRQSITAAPAQLSALLAQCADMGATLFVHSPYAEAESSSPELGARGGLRQVNYTLAKSLLLFLAEEAAYYGTALHVHSIASKEELDILAPFRQKGGLTASIPLHVLFAQSDTLGYGFAGRIWPALIGESQKAALLEAVLAGGADAITSHSHIFSEALELDPLSSEPGADLFVHLPAWMEEVQAKLGAARWGQLAEENPAKIVGT